MNFKRLKIIMILIFCLFIYNCSSTIDSDFQYYVLEELNYVRTNPIEYAENRLKSYHDSNNDNGAYDDIKGRSSVGALSLNKNLNKAANDYARYLAKNDVFGHYEYKTPSERCEDAGYSNYSGENLAAGSYSYYNVELDSQEAAISFVRALIIDEGVPSLGHRNNIMSSNHKVVGIGYYYDNNSTYKNYHVQDFGSR